MVTRLKFPVHSAEAFAELRRRFVALPAKPKLLPTREGGIDISSPGRQSLSLLVGEESAGVLYATDVYLSPGFGAPPHHQPTEDELWYLLEGTLDARVGLRSVSLTPGAFAYIPRDTTHTFRNNGSDLVRLLAWNAPGGHERAFEAMRAKAEQGITDFPSLREVMGHHGIDLHRDAAETAANDVPGAKLSSKVLAGRSQGRDASQAGADVRVLLDPAESAGRYEVRDVLLAPRSPPLRLGEARAHACFYVLEGDADVTLDERRHRVGRGAFGYLPAEHAASIAAQGDTPVHVVTWTTTIAS
jgi:mannose-6-phosphate isomerase-like protein (cupin superfamily)